MNFWLALPLPLRLCCLALCGAVLGSFVNWGIYALAWFHPRAISPWSTPPDKSFRRTFFDRIPIVGWLSLRRESQHFGTGHWIRPMLLELACAIGLAWLYVWEINFKLLPSSLYLSIPTETPHYQFLAHAVLIFFMLIATFIDFDEQTIPDSITIPGTLLGLIIITLLPQALPHVLYDYLDSPSTIEPLWFTTQPRSTQPIWFDGWLGCMTGISCFVAWCYILIPKLCTLRRGWYKGWLYVHASTWRSPELKRMLFLACLGSVAIGYVYSHGGEHWHALLTSLIGMAFGGGLIWAVRIAGFVALRKEAMGFGDVTLMCMIGAFLGWQSSIIVFFLAPFCAVIIALTQFLLTRRRDIAFGPYLCGGALTLIIYWPWLWDNYGAGLFSLGKIVPLLLLCGLMVMMSLLWLWRLFEQMLFATKEE